MNAGKTDAKKPSCGCWIVVLTTFLVSILGSSGVLLAGEKAEQATRTEDAIAWQQDATEYARILSRVQWTPVADRMPNRRGGYFEKGKQYTGVPYSSVRSVGRYIGFDISLRTFLAAVENPRSVLYTENLSGTVPNAACYYGTVCSSYTSYALQCGIWHVSRHHGPQFRDGVTLVEPQSAQAAKVGDIIYSPPRPGSHVEIVTEITTDENGTVTHVWVEESAPPTTRTTQRSAANFNSHLSSRGRELFRITDLDTWRGDNQAERLLFPDYQADSAIPTINRTLLLDLGDWIPYRKGQAVKFNVMDRDDLGVKTLVIKRAGTVIEEVNLSGTRVVERSFETCGDYTAHVVLNDGSLSQACEFSVCDLDFHVSVDEVPLRKAWKIEFTSDNMNPIAVYLWNGGNSYGRYPVFLTERDRKQGRVTIPADLLQKSGALQVWLIGEHRYGRLKVRKDIAVVE